MVFVPTLLTAWCMQLSVFCVLSRPFDGPWQALTSPLTTIQIT